MLRRLAWLLAAAMILSLSVITYAEDAMTYSTQEIWCNNNGQRIYGVAYIPDGVAQAPLIIFSHELGNSHATGIPYAERLVAQGYAVYTFDFPGGSAGGTENRSDGSSVGMSVMTEAAALNAVIDSAKNWDYVDPEKIVLLGGSQGGLVSAIVACRRDDLAGLMLMYPALCAAHDVHEQFAGPDDIPEQYGMFGGWITVGDNYARDIWDLDIYAELADYSGKVLLLHGDRDYTVDLSWSEQAVEVIPECEFHVIPNGGHEFFGQPFEEAVTYILDYLAKHIGQ